MAGATIIGYFGKREWTALAILAAVFAALMAFDFSGWSLVVVSVLFIVYASRTASVFFMTQRSFSGRSIAAYAWPVGIAVIQTLLCLGLVWLVVWVARHVFGRGLS